MEPDTVNCCPVLIDVVDIATDPDNVVRATVIGFVGSDNHAVW